MVTDQPLKRPAHPLNSALIHPFKRKPALLALRPTTPPSRSDQLAQRDAAQKDVFLREVDDALRQDQMLGFAQNYGKPLAAVVIAGLLGLAGYLWYDHEQKQSAAERSERFMIALDRLGAGAGDAADKDLAGLAAEGSDGTRAAAMMMRAALSLEQGKRDAATKGFAALAADTAAPQPYRDLAAIREIALNFDTLPPQQVIDRLKPLAVPGNPWFGSAGELVGVAYLKQNKPQLAGALFAAIGKDKTVPASLSSRMRQMAAQLGVDPVEDVDKAVSAAQAANPAPAAPAAAQ